MKRLTLLAITGMLALALVVPATVAAAPQRNQLLSDVPVSGALADGGSFVGNISIDSITQNADGALEFAGTLTGTATDATGAITEIDQAFSAVLGSLTGSTGKCDILFLDLGPIFLDLLGLTVDLSPIELDVDAVPGPGNLLGNLLCAVTGLLDNPGSGLSAILNLVNRLLG